MADEPKTVAVGRRAPGGRDYPALMREAARRLNSGESEQEIRYAMSLSRKQWNRLMKFAKAAAWDRTKVWAKHKIAMEELIRQYQFLYQAAMGRINVSTGTRYEEGKGPAPNIAEARQNLDKIRQTRRELLETGQSLGIYDKAPEVHEHIFEDPTAGMFIEEAEKDGPFADELLH